MLRILTVLHTMPNVKSYRTLCFENILDYLKTKSDVHMTWLVYMPDKLNVSLQNDSNITILDIHGFKNAVEVIQTVKPDIIWVAPTLNLPDYAFALAGKFLKIPVVGELVNELFIKSDQFDAIKTYISQFFQSSVPTDAATDKKQFMKRGRFFLYKYLFLLRTQKAVKMNTLKILEDFFTIVKAYLTVMKHLHNPKFAVNLHFVESQTLVESLVRNGFERSSLVVSGIPMYDKVFQKLQELQKSSLKQNDDKIHILLLTHAMYEHGYWTRGQRDRLVKEVVSEAVKYSDEMSLTVKIHPSSEILSEYQHLVNPIDPKIPIHQKGDILDFIFACDIVLAYSTESALFYALVLGKPVIILNFFGLEHDLFLERGLVYECKETSSLISLIKQGVKSNVVNRKKLDDFIEEFLYKLDGRSSERIGNTLLDLSDNYKKKSQ